MAKPRMNSRKAALQIARGQRHSCDRRVSHITKAVMRGARNTIRSVPSDQFTEEAPERKLVNVANQDQTPIAALPAKKMATKPPLIISTIFPACSRVSVRGTD